MQCTHIFISAVSSIFPFTSTVFSVTASKSINKLLPVNKKKRKQNDNQMQSTSRLSHDKYSSGMLDSEDPSIHKEESRGGRSGTEMCVRN